MSINLTVTDAGIKAAFSAENNGFKISIKEIGFGNAQYEVTGAETALQGEFVRVPVTSATQQNKTLILGLTYASPETKNVSEIGAYLDDGTLFAVFAWPDSPRFQLSDVSDFIFRCVLILKGLPADVFEVSIGSQIDLEAHLRISALEEQNKELLAVQAKLLEGQARMVLRHMRYHHDDPTVADDFSSTFQNYLK